MRHVFAALVASVLTLTAGGILASGVAPGEMTEPPIPCLDTTGDARKLIELAGDNASQPQQVYGRFTSWNPKTTTLGFKSDLSQKLEQIPIRAVHFEPRKPNPAAQAAMSNLVRLGSISRSYLPSEVSVVEGILKLPECSLKYDDKQLAFEGRLTFSGRDVRIEGKVFKIVPLAGGRGDSTTSKGG